MGPGWSGAWGTLSVAPRGTLQGQVTSETTGEPLADVEITISGPQSDVVATNQEGRYIFEGLTPGTYTVTANKADYQDFVEEIQVSAGSNVYDIRMSPLVRIRNMEVTQGVPNPAGYVAGKPTLVRVFVDVDSTQVITGHLNVYRVNADGQETPIPGSPFTSSFTAKPTTKYSWNERFNLKDSLNFPPELSGYLTLDEGRYHFETSVLTEISSVEKTFVERPGIKYLSYFQGALNTTAFAKAPEIARKTYPVVPDSIRLEPPVEVPELLLPVPGFKDLQLLKNLELRKWWYNRSHPDDPAKIAVGFMPAGTFGGEAGRWHARAAGAILVEMREDLISHIFAHETGHAFGLGEEYQVSGNIFGNCGAYKCDVNPPASTVRCRDRLGLRQRQACPNTTAEGDMVGVYIEYRAVEVALRERRDVFWSPSRGAYLMNHNFMGSAIPRVEPWISKRTFDHLFGALKPSTDALEAYLRQTDEYILLSGMIYKDDRAEIDPAYRLHGPTTPANCEGGPYAIQLEDELGAVLSRCEFDLQFVPPLGSGAFTTTVDSFVYVIPYQEDTARIAITHDGNTIAAREVSPSAPSVTVTTPNGGEVWSGEQTITWTASDPDGDDLFSTLFYSADGEGWSPIATDVSGTSFVWDTTYCSRE